MHREATRISTAQPLPARFVTRAAISALVAWGTCKPVLAQTAALFEIPTELKASSVLPPDSPWQLLLHVTDAAALANVLRVSPPSVGASVLDYTLGGYPEIAGDPARTWLEETFVIDYRDRGVVDLYARFTRATAGRPWGRQALVDFVASSMTAAFGHPIEIASQVARDRNGDCKEYAVVTVGLARSAGVPARVAFGVVIIERDGRYATFGHAWAETRENGHWVVADAALKGGSGVMRYLPLGILSDEGPGFQVAIMHLTPTWVQRVTIIGFPFPAVEQHAE